MARIGQEWVGGSPSRVGPELSRWENPAERPASEPGHCAGAAAGLIEPAAALHTLLCRARRACSFHGQVGTGRVTSCHVRGRQGELPATDAVQAPEVEWRERRLARGTIRGATDTLQTPEVQAAKTDRGGGHCPVASPRREGHIIRTSVPDDETGPQPRLSPFLSRRRRRRAARSLSGDGVRGSAISLGVFSSLLD